MGVSERFFEYLEHLGSTVPVRTFYEEPEASDLVALRHDVDHDIDAALELAAWENYRGCRATFYLLHTAPYWGDDRLLDKALQIQDFGHEVGLHLNVLSEWVRGETRDVATRLDEVLSHLRKAGLEVVGTSAHGDRLCYERQFANYWSFAELRPDDPALDETGRSAEGVETEDERFRLIYPADGMLHDDQGRAFPFWSVSMDELGLTYDAIHAPHDQYFTDSGGGWKRSPDPLAVDLGTGRHQVLLHPEYWMDENQRISLFLSTARSGSVWLSRQLDEGTPLLARHEFALNHRFNGEELREEKRTGQGFAELMKRPGEVQSLLVESRWWIEEQGRDYGEANVYLVHFLDLVEEVFPDARMAHLHRDPRDVVRSLLLRDWYDTPEDDRHPRLDVEGWDLMTQFEKVCWYARKVNEALVNLDVPRFALEEIATDPQHLASALREVGVPFYPRLAATTFREVANAARSHHIASYDEWPADWKKTFDGICGGVRERLGYVRRGERGFVRARFRHLGASLRRIARRLRPRRRLQPRLLADVRFGVTPPDDEPFAYRGVGCRMDETRDGLVVTPDGDRHATVVFGGPEWSRAGDSEGWPAQIAFWYRGDLSLEVEGGPVTLFALMYGLDGSQIDRRQLARVDGACDAHVAFTTRPDASRFAIGVYASRDLPVTRLSVRRLRIEAVPR